MEALSRKIGRLNLIETLPFSSLDMVASSIIRLALSFTCDQLTILSTFWDVLFGGSEGGDVVSILSHRILETDAVIVFSTGTGVPLSHMI